MTLMTDALTRACRWTTWTLLIGGAPIGIHALYAAVTKHNQFHFDRFIADGSLALLGSALLAAAALDCRLLRAAKTRVPVGLATKLAVVTVGSSWFVLFCHLAIPEEYIESGLVEQGVLAMLILSVVVSFAIKSVLFLEEAG